MINPSKIISETERVYNLPKGSIVSRRRTKTISEARDVAIFVTRRMTKLSSTEIGEYYFNRDHSTVLNSVKKARDNVSSKLIDRIMCLVRSK